MVAILGCVWLGLIYLVIFFWVSYNSLGNPSRRTTTSSLSTLAIYIYRAATILAMWWSGILVSDVGLLDCSRLEIGWLAILERGFGWVDRLGWVRGLQRSASFTNTRAVVYLPMVWEAGGIGRLWMSGTSESRVASGGCGVSGISGPCCPQASRFIPGSLASIKSFSFLGNLPVSP